MLNAVIELTPVSEAFKGSTLELPASPPAATVESITGSSGLITSIMMGVFVILAIVTLPDFIRILPKLADCYSRKKGCINMEYSVSSSRDRNFIAAALSIPFCIVADRLDFYCPRILDFIPHGWMSLALMGVLLAYITLRGLTGLIVRKPYHILFEEWRASRLAWVNYFILLVFIALITYGILLAFSIPAGTIRKVLLIETAAIYGLSFLRTADILKDNCSLLGTFLYLCALEIIPTGILVASAMFL